MAIYLSLLFLYVMLMDYLNNDLIKVVLMSVACPLKIDLKPIILHTKNRAINLMRYQ